MNTQTYLVYTYYNDKKSKISCKSYLCKRLNKIDWKYQWILTADTSLLRDCASVILPLIADTICFCVGNKRLLSSVIFILIHHWQMYWDFVGSLLENVWNSFFVLHTTLIWKRFVNCEKLNLRFFIKLSFSTLSYKKTCKISYSLLDFKSKSSK